MNYMQLNEHPIQLSFKLDRTSSFSDVYHAHQGMELLYIHEGQGQIVLERKIHEVGPGTLIFFRPYQLHRVRIETAKGRYVRSLFVFEPSVLEAFLTPFPALKSFFLGMLKQSEQRQVIGGFREEDIGALFQAHQPETGDIGLPGERLEEEALFLISFLRAVKRHGLAEGGPVHGSLPEAAGTAEWIMHWLEQRYAEPFSLKELASAVHLSPNHVSHLFRKTTGSSITEYLTARRMRESCWLLKSTDWSVERIGQSVGLTNFSYFCQLFKKHVGMTPHRFRQIAKGQRREQAGKRLGREASRT